MHSISAFGLWLDYLGVSPEELARELSLYRHTVRKAAERGSRRCRWLKGAALLLQFPAAILVGIPPDDYRAAPHRQRALEAAASRRLSAARSRALAKRALV
jgi:hypothetical protein